MRILRISVVIVALAVILSVSVFAAGPVILAQPQSVYLPSDVVFPTYVHFSVLASGNDLSYQWQASLDHGNTWVNTSSPGSQTQNVQITVTDLVINGQRLYRCLISDESETVATQVVTASVSAYTLDSLPQFLAWLSESSFSIFDWVGSCCNQIVQQPLLLFTVGFLALGGSIAIFSRILSRS